MNSKDKEKYICKADLKYRGWNKSLINKYLPTPDKLVHNLRGPNKICLYLLSKIEDLESNNEYIKTQIAKSKDKRQKFEQKKENKLLDKRNKEIDESNEVIKIVSSSIERGLTSFESVITIHCGPTNSGKTYNALLDLKTAINGCFLAPLRLLAWEIYHKLNADGIYASLITGEERIIVPGATIYSSTVEMFDPDKIYDCVILDEAHMIDDDNRGYAWLRVLLFCKAKRFHIITSPEALNLISEILTRLNKKFEIKNYERLVPLKMAEKPYDINRPLDRTIYVVFSRSDALSLKKFFEDRGKKVSIIYGNLPPEVRRLQIENFLNLNNSICVATDAIGQGINLPADRVCFVSTTKFDGRDVRQLKSLEVKQIAGRAGRYQLCEFGEVGALSKHDRDFIDGALNAPLVQKYFAKIYPELNELLVFEEKRLSSKLIRWKYCNSLPYSLRDIVDKTDLDEQIELAMFFSLEQQELIGIENVFKLIKAPVKKDKYFWINCCNSILLNKSLPIPNILGKINNDDFLLDAEIEINNCEVYSWINNCTNFSNLCSDIDEVKRVKDLLIDNVNGFLISKNKKFGGSNNNNNNNNNNNRRRKRKGREKR